MTAFYGKSSRRIWQICKPGSDQAVTRDVEAGCHHNDGHRMHLWVHGSVILSPVRAGDGKPPALVLGSLAAHVAGRALGVRANEQIG